MKEPLRPSEQHTWRNGNKSNIAYSTIQYNIAYPFITSSTKQVALYIIKYGKVVYIFCILSKPSKK